MESKADLQKLTVPNLKEKLKQRHLTTTGTKSELIDRLVESFQEEENLLVRTEGAGDLDVDDLLGTSSLGDQNLISSEEALLLGLPLKSDIPKPADTPKASVPKSQSKPIETPRATISPPKTQSPKSKGPPKIEALAQKVESNESKASDKHPISLKSDSQLLERAKRFGLPLQKDNNETAGKVDTADKVEVASNGDSKPKIPRILSGEDNEAKQQRLKRFGLPVQKDSGEAASNGDSKSKIPRVLSGEDDEAKQRRLKRFGLPVIEKGTSDAGNNGASKPKIPRITADVDDETVQRRLKRFG